MVIDDEPLTISMSIYKCETGGVAPTLSIGKCIRPGVDRHITKDSNVLVVDGDS
jgi:hypothetical protein